VTGSRGGQESPSYIAAKIIAGTFIVAQNLSQNSTLPSASPVFRFLKVPRAERLAPRSLLGGRVGRWCGRVSNDADGSIAPSKIPYGAFSRFKPPSQIEPSHKLATLSLLPAYGRYLAVCFYPSHVSTTKEVLALRRRLSRLPRAAVRETFPPYPQGSLAPVRVVLPRSILAYYSRGPVPRARCDFTFTLIRNAFAVRERRGDPRDLPYFRYPAFPACR